LGDAGDGPHPRTPTVPVNFLVKTKNGANFD
jgi:hypothetical protein